MPCLGKNRERPALGALRQRRGVVFLTVKPESGQMCPVAGQSDRPERRRAVIDVIHVFFLLFLCCGQVPRRLTEGNLLLIIA